MKPTARLSRRDALTSALSLPLAVGRGLSTGSAPAQPAASRVRVLVACFYFATGELARRCLEALRMAEGRVVAAEEIAVAALRDNGLDPEDRKTHSDFIQRVLNTLTALKGKGTVSVPDEVWFSGTFLDAGGTGRQ